MMKKIDFRNVELRDIEGKVMTETKEVDGKEVEVDSTLDISKNLGNTIFRNTDDLGELDFARELYKKGEVEVNAERARMILKYLKQGKYLAFVREGIEPVLNGIINNE